LYATPALSANGHDALGHAATATRRWIVTNIRKATSPHWRNWLKPESRCLVPANSFAEYRRGSFVGHDG